MRNIQPQQVEALIAAEEARAKNKRTSEFYANGHYAKICAFKTVNTNYTSFAYFLDGAQVDRFTLSYFLKEGAAK